MNEAADGPAEEVIEKKPLGVRSKRRAANANMDEFVVKTTLSATVVPSEYKPNLIHEIQKRVLAGSKAVHRLSMAINVLIRECLNQKTDIRGVKIPEFLSENSTSFAYQLMLGEGHKDIPEARNFLDKWNHKLPAVPERFSGDRNTLVRAAEMYLTNFKTYLTTTFHKHQKAFFYDWQSRHKHVIADKKQVYILIRLINQWNLPDNIELPYWVTSPVVQRIIEFHKSFFGDNVVVSDIWMKKNYERMIVYDAMISKYLQKRGLKGIPVAPVSKIRSTFIHIDTSVMHGIMKNVGMIQGNYDVFQSSKDQNWDMCFNTKKLITVRNRETTTFTGTVQTDGFAVCIHYRRPKKTISITKHVRYEDDREFSNDPGRARMATILEVLADGTEKLYILTRQRYYKESGCKKAQQQSEKWNCDLSDTLQALSKCNTKTYALKDFEKYLQTIMLHYDTLWDHFGEAKWNSQRFRTTGGKKSVRQKFINSLDDGSNRRIVIAYGNGSFAPTGKGEKAVPVTTLYREMCRAYIVILIDEFRTTQVHCETGARLAEVKEYIKEYRKLYGSKSKGVTVRGLLWCNSTNNQIGKFIDRDINAARNILKCYTSAERPEALRRGTPAQDKSTKRILKKWARASRHLRRVGLATDNLYLGMFH